MSITLYEFAPTRSARVRWTLLELGLPFESIEGREVFSHPGLADIHPLAKIPAIRDGGRPLFESAAICNWLADSHFDKGLIPAAGTWARALHDQWVTFTLSELEAYLWSNARNTFLYPEAERVPAVFPQNDREAKRALGVFETHLAGRTFLVEERFQVTDIFVGYALHWAARRELTAGLPHVEAYLDRLLARPHCPYGKA